VTIHHPSEQESEERIVGRSAWFWPVLLAFLIQTVTISFFLGSAWRQIAINTEHIDRMDAYGTRALEAAEADIRNLKERLDRADGRGGK
jgi:hypothetical protein